ncbi:MAG: hypothetical protein IPO95_07400 [Rhodanobacteraceae bacterium]|nr:hypothetical protein [Rhodanobacteraceae bacterium]
MKLWTVMMMAGGMLLPVLATAQPPRPEEAVAKLGLSPELREQVLATFAAARSKQEALREGAEAQRAANDAAFCAIRSETQAALAKILSREQLDALNAAMRPPRHPEGGERGGPEHMRGRRDDRPDGEHRPPPPPRCDDAPASNPPKEA